MGLFRLTYHTDTRKRYIKALRQADKHGIGPLIEFIELLSLLASSDGS